MQKRVRFSSVNIGDEFIWAAKPFKKVAEHRALCKGIPTEFIFNKGDVVLIEELEVMPYPYELNYDDVDYNDIYNFTQP